MTFEQPVKLTTKNSTGLVLLSTGGTLHQLNLWYSNFANAIGYGTYNNTTKLTTWTIYLSLTTSNTMRGFALDSEFTFLWGPSLNVVDMATPVGIV